MKKKNYLVIFLSLILMLLLFNGCTNEGLDNTKEPSETEAKNGGELKIAMYQNPRNLNPIIADDTPSHDVIDFIFDPLLKNDENGNLVPKVAEEYPTISEDGKAITFKLKKGWKWHDGVELTAEDVKFSYELIKDDTINSYRKGNMESIESVEAPDDYTVIFKLNKPDSQIIQEFANNIIVPKHILEKVDKASMKTYSFSRKPVGNGPFKFVEWQTSERIVLEANLDYFDGQPLLDKVVFFITPSSSTALVKLQTGEVNMVAISPGEIERVKESSDLVVYTYASTGLDCIQYNIQSQFFEDKSVRQAVSYAINIDSIIKGIYKNNAVPALTSYPPSLWVHNSDVRKYEYNIEKANQLLDEAGWKLGSDGIREKGGKKFEFELLTNKGNEEREKFVVYTQNALKEIGISVKPRILEWNTLFDNYVDAGKFDAYVGGYRTDTNITQQEYYAKTAFFNAGKYYSPELEEKFNSIKQTFDREEQKKLAYEAQQILTEDLPMTYLVFRTSAYALNKNVKNVKFVDMYGMFDIEKWYVED